MGVTTKFYCDVCKSTTDVQCALQLQVIFTTEQTEGRPIAPYRLNTKKMDICSDCMNRVLDGEAIFAHGAQGLNTYYFKRKES